MLNQRRTRLLRDIADESVSNENVSEAVLRIMRTLADYKSDIAGALIFLENDAGSFDLASSTSDVEAFTELSRWPVEQVVGTRQPFFFDNVIERFGANPNGEFRESIQRACLMPITLIGHKKPIGLMAVTLSTRLPYNEAYMAFIDLLNEAVCGIVAKALANESGELERNDLQTDIRDLTVQRDTQEVAAQNLQLSKEAAEAATRSKSAFLANMSHEIRTPLAAILGFSEILKSRDLDLEDRDRYLNIITRNGHSLVRIIDDILDLSKIEAGKVQLENEPLCLVELIQDVIAMFSDRAMGKGLALNFDPTGLHDCRIRSDAVRIRQILINLIGNAIKFTTEGSVTVSGAFRLIENSRCVVNIRVSDTGIGITEEQGKMLFQAFSQADNKTTRHFGGTGLGLALSRKLAVAMGGDVSIERSGKERGSTFLVELNANQCEDASDVITQPILPTPEKSVKRLAGWTVLVVDDSEDNRLLIKILLGREGAVVSEATSGEDAIAKAHMTGYDVILMDIQMPELDGYQALAKLRNGNYKRPVFALTAHSMKEEKDRALAAGFSGHISKPVNPSTLVETLLAHARRLH